MRSRFKILCAVITLFTTLQFSVSATSFEYNLDNDRYLTISGTVEGDVSGENVYIQVVKPNKIVDDLNNDNYKDIINQSIIVTTEDGGKYTYTYKMSGGEGYYTIRVNDGNSIAEKKFYFVSPERLQEIIDELKNPNLTPDVGTLKTKITATYKDALTLNTDIFEIIESVPDRANIIFANIFNSLSKIDNVNDLKNIFNSEVLVQYINISEPDELDELLSDDGNVALIGHDVTNTDTYNLLSEIGKKAFYDNISMEEFKDIEQLKSKIKVILLLTAVDYVASWTDINAIITENKDIISFDYERYCDYSQRNEIDRAIAGNTYTLTSLGNKIDKMSASDSSGGASSAIGGFGSSSGSSGSRVSGGSLGGVSMPSISAPQSGDISDKTSVKIFVDITSHWAKTYIEKLQSFGIVNGVNDTEFAPDNNISREEFVKMLVNVFKLEKSDNDSMAFDDISKDHWSYQYVVTARKFGIVQGYDSNKFGLGENITREDMMVLLDRAYDICQIEMFSLSDEVMFNDFDLVSEYAQNAVVNMAEKGVISGYADGSFGGKKPATRAETCKILSAFVDYID